jgi:hypothetical protein
MKQKSLLITLVAALLALPLTAGALPVSVNFAQVTTPIDITLPATGTVDQVTFSYDNSPAGGGSAEVNSSGIIGVTGILDPGPPPFERNNTLIIDFTGTPIPQIYYLLVTFSLPGMTADDPFGAMADLFYQGAFVSHVDVPVFQADPNGTITSAGPIFDTAFLNFSSDASLFLITDVTYEAVPEPGTIILVAAGLLGLGVLRRTKKI